MTTTSFYSTSGIPNHIKWQILSFQRIVWAEGFSGKNLYRDWVTREEFHPVTFVVMQGDLLLSHLQVVWKNLEHKGKVYKTYGFSGVFTYPSHRRGGLAVRLIRAGSDYIKQQRDADLIFFTTTVEGLYETTGFEQLENAKVFIGNREKPELYNEFPYAKFISEKGLRGKEDFVKYPVYFGECIW